LQTKVMSASPSQSHQVHHAKPAAQQAVHGADVGFKR
jgi:hypothetical protein